MKNITINHKNNDKNEVTLLLKNRSFEVMQQTINANATIWIEPATELSTVEFFYIVSGELLIELGDKNELLVPGDSFYIQNLTEKIHLSTHTEVCLVYVTNSLLYEDIASFQDNVKKIREIMDHKDEYSSNHSRRCHLYCSILYQLTEDKSIYDYESLVLSALGHDIGKSIVPTDILKKYPNLNKEEKKIYYRHINDSSKMIDQLFGSKIAKIVSYHHEYLDGSGFFGITSESLTPEMRMLAITNDFDHLVYDKKSKPKMDFLRAAKVLLSKSNQYDSKIVKLLIKAIEEKHITEDIQSNLSKIDID